VNRLTGATTRVVVALLSIATVVLPNALAVAQGGCSRVTRGQYWTTFDVPDFPNRGSIVSYAVVPFQPRTMFATNGVDVLRTTDGGCKWTEVYSVTGKTPLDHGFRGDSARIVAVHVPRSPAANERVLLVIEESVHTATRPHVVRSDDAGNTWVTGDAGLPPTGRPETLVTTSIDHNVGYLGIDVGDGGLDLVFATVDGGATWSLRSNLTQTAPNRAITGLSVDPLAPNELWAFGPGGLFRSSDGGASFALEPQFRNSAVSEVDVFHAPARQHGIVLAFRPEEQDVRISTDDGESWPRYDTPGPVESAVFGRVPTELMISVGGKIYLYSAPSDSWIGLITPRSGIGGLSSDQAVEQDFYGKTTGTIERYEGPTTIDVPPPTARGPSFDIPGLLDGAPPAPLAEPALGPPDVRVRMKTGASKPVDYRLRLDERTTKLDVFFLIDTSDTMSGTIQGLIDSVGGIINSLRRAGLDVQFGLGVSRAYTDTAVPREPCESDTDTNCERNFIYRRLVDISDYSNADELEAALATLRAEAGGRFDSQLGALWAIATGNQIDDDPPGMQPSDVEAGQEATFREDALNLVFVATDEPFATGNEGDRDFSISDFGRITPPDIPSFETVAGEMAVHDAKVLGLAIGQTLKTDDDATQNDAPTPLGDMQEIARLTGAFAPEGGVDCDGDGTVELTAGMPLVCPVRRHDVDDGRNLAAAITKLVEAVRGTTSVELDVVRGNDVVAGIEPAVHPRVVLQQPNVLDYQVTYRCPDRLQGKKVTVELAARTPLRTLDRVTTTVACLEEKVPEPLPIEPAIAIGLVLPPFLPPAPPIVEIAPGAQGQAQTQSQAQAQGAMAHQEQEQPQLAYVGATLDHRQALEEELAMSDRRRSEVPQWATLGAGAAMMSLAYGWLVVSRQRSVRVQRVRRY
jgi:hypothetical protein